jgi:hypothetical protein
MKVDINRNIKVLTEILFLLAPMQLLLMYLLQIEQWI